MKRAAMIKSVQARAAMCGFPINDKLAGRVLTILLKQQRDEQRTERKRDRLMARIRKLEREVERLRFQHTTFRVGGQ